MTAQPSHARVPVASEDLMRADLYGFLANMLARPPDEAALARIASLSGDDGEIGRAFGELSRRAAVTDARQAAREFDALFIGLGRGELVPFASFYLTGFLNEKPLVRLRDDMRRLGIARADGVSEPEDAIASLLEIMAGLIRGEFGDPRATGDQAAFFEAHVAPWAGHFFSDLEGAASAVFYAPLGRIGRCFVEVEREAFRMFA